MTIYSFETLPSTQRWLADKAAAGEVEIPCAVITEFQSDGIGSRNNRWIGKRGNFFASVAVKEADLPEDLPLTAVSIYFAWTMKKVLQDLGSEAWVKWPNDLYLKQRKIGGCITAKKGDLLIAGIGLNIVDAPRDFGVLDISMAPMQLLETFLKELEKKRPWKQIFSNYSLEFCKSRNFRTHSGDETVDLKDAVLQSDGTLMIGKRRIVSQR
ncbi:biotin--[acetyl-CoA-carboxylase] ligase [Hydrogenimonas sp. SS33]|uniref:biotin--[acetyl-CoA-carboxylase] ligase n=1 Tax=Hydrogenimonas leucolamina TaxID=2954236 RepID=UPI00336BC776